MTVIGLTGCIGAGKSTVAAMLAARGAVLVDTDEISHDVIAPQMPAYAAIVERFGDGVVSPSGAIDRSALGEIVFSDPDALFALEGIVHPEVQRVVSERLIAESAARVVVLEVPLLVLEDGFVRYPCDGVLVVDAPEDICIARLVERRAMSEDDARARLAAQIPRATRLRAAQFVIVNMGNLDELEAMVDGAWRWIESIEPASEAPAS